MAISSHLSHRLSLFLVAARLSLVRDDMYSILKCWFVFCHHVSRYKQDTCQDLHTFFHITTSYLIMLILRTAKVI